MSGVRVGLLGPFEASVGGRVLEVSSLKHRALLATLALEAGRVVPVAALVDGVWGDPVPDRAERTLQQHVSTLRKLLATEVGDAAAVLETSGRGYVLHTDSVDVDDFAAAGDRASRAAGLDDWAEALRAADEALDLWRGPALADVGDSPRLAAAGVRLGEQRLAVLEVRFEAALACGQDQELVADLEVLIGEHPLRERLHGLLMLALYRCGRQAEALLAYQSARRTLVDELGIEPGPELRALENEVLLQSPLLDLPRRGAESAPPVTTDDLDVPRPARLAAAGAAALAGRRPELARLEQAGREADAGSRRVVLLAGEPGVGKTALAAHGASRAAEVGAVVAYGRWDEDLGIPYQGWSEAIDHLVRHAPEELLTRHAAARGGALRTLARSFVEQTGWDGGASEDREAERFLLFGAVDDLLERITGRAPLVLVLDDLHWADRQSLQLLRHVVANGLERRLLVVGTYRDSEVGTGHPLHDLLADLRREAGIERLALGGLDVGELGELLEVTAGHHLDGPGLALRDALAAETDGNPFFVGEMLRHLVESGALVRDGDGRWVGAAGVIDAPLPASVREVVARRVTRLGTDTADVLALASVIGRDFDLPLLARVSALDERELVDLLDGAIRSSVIAETDELGHFTFAHALTGRTLYEAQSALRRSHAHASIAVALEELCGPDPGDRVGELAFHWARASGRDPAKAVGYARSAGDRALARFAPDEAVRWYRSALDLLDHAGDDAVRVRILVALGDAQRQAGDAASRATLLDAASRADEVGDIESLATAAIANFRGWASSTGSVDEERVAVLRRALAAVGPDPSPHRALLLATLCAEVLFQAPFEDRLALAEEAVAVARQVGDDRTLLEVLVRTHEAIVAPPSLARRLEWTAEGCELADRVGDPALRLSAHVFRYLATLESCDGDAARRSLAVAAAEADHVGQPVTTWSVAVLDAMDIAVSGELDSAEAASLRAFELGVAAAQPDAAGGYGMQVLSLRWMQGRLAETIPMLEQVASDFSAVAAMRSGLGLGYTVSGQLDEAAALLAAEHEAGFERGVASGWLASHAMWALVACATGDEAAGAALYELLRPYEEHFMSTHITAYGPVAYPLGRLARLLGRDDDAAVHFERAHDLNLRAGAAYFRTRADLDWAELLLERAGPGDRARASEVAAAALEVARARSYGDLEAALAEVAERSASQAVA